MAQDGKTHDGIQEALNKWYPRTMNIFGRRDSKRNAIYRKFGLKKRDNDDVRQTFAKDIHEKAEEFGLKVPDWKPVPVRSEVRDGF